MQAVATLKYARISAQKARLVGDQIRGHARRAGAERPSVQHQEGRGIFKKVLESAIANAEHNEGR
jgi:large subunit ribosomal protein L22